MSNWEGHRHFSVKTQAEKVSLLGWAHIIRIIIDYESWTTIIITTRSWPELKVSTERLNQACRVLCLSQSHLRLLWSDTEKILIVVLVFICNLFAMIILLDIIVRVGRPENLAKSERCQIEGFRGAIAHNKRFYLVGALAVTRCLPWVSGLYLQFERACSSIFSSCMIV